MSYLTHLRNLSSHCYLLVLSEHSKVPEKHLQQVSSCRRICSCLYWHGAALLSCDQGHRILLGEVCASRLPHLGGFLEELPLLIVRLTVQILLLFICLLTSIIRNFSPSNHTGSLIIILFALYSLSGVITADHASSMEENSQADTCSRVRGMPSPAHLTLNRPLCPLTAYKTDGLPGLMSVGMTKHMGSSHKICHASLPANLTFLSYFILFDNLSSLRVFY